MVLVSSNTSLISFKICNRSGSGSVKAKRSLREANFACKSLNLPSIGFQYFTPNRSGCVGLDCRSAGGYRPSRQPNSQIATIREGFVRGVLKSACRQRAISVDMTYLTAVTPGRYGELPA